MAAQTQSESKGGTGNVCRKGDGKACVVRGILDLAMHRVDGDSKLVDRSSCFHRLSLSLSDTSSAVHVSGARTVAHERHADDTPCGSHLRPGTGEDAGHCANPAGQHGRRRHGNRGPGSHGDLFHPAARAERSPAASQQGENLPETGPSGLHEPHLPPDPSAGQPVRELSKVEGTRPPPPVTSRGYN
ncbi:hypothetical protein chiPu_0027067, partial [Chiloscyllium punctatum]|nr:hypothetical protein [Chiloscyllium punctatum]